MDLLDQYKKAWENQPENEQKVSKTDIYRMTKLRSSSIIKWIFLIGIMEFSLLTSSYFFMDYDYINQQYKELGLENFYILFQIAAYIVIIYFLRKFYLNYKNISVTDNTKGLMNQILKTRRTVKNYVLVNLILAAIVMIVLFVKSFYTKIEELTFSKSITIIGIYIIVIIFILFLFWLVYQLLYGILLKKLNKNYRNLSDN
ncbi:MAG: hypothetical protein MK202_06140 [Tenacibaculum sp.]|nr:hypothetical protein [Tenacibaculum sp.]